MSNTSIRVPRPRVLSLKPENIPLPLRRSNTCMNWRSMFKQSRDAATPGKWTKVPTQPNGAYASSTNPATWSSFKECVAAYQAGLADGVGFVTSASDPYVLIDLDHCFDPTTGVIEPWAVPILKAALREGAYVELSPSGTGFHIIAKGPQGFKGLKNNGGEMYCSGRFFTLTGVLPFGETPRSLGRLDKTVALVSAHIGVAVSTKQTTTKGTKPTSRPITNAVAGKRPYTASMSDADILKMAFKKKNGDKLKRLMSGDLSDYGGDASRADLALASMLSFWFWLDADAIERVMIGSKLFRDKWETKRGKVTYLRYTIAAALKDKTDYFGKPRPVGFRTFGYTSDTVSAAA
jgi:putative DNA primase/helicase